MIEYRIKQEEMARDLQRRKQREMYMLKNMVQEIRKNEQFARDAKQEFLN